VGERLIRIGVVGEKKKIGRYYQGDAEKKNRKEKAAGSGRTSD